MSKEIYSGPRTAPRDEIGNLTPFGAGRSTRDVMREFGLTKVANLASNENQLGPSPKAVLAAQEAAVRANLYPDAQGRALKRELVSIHGIGPEHMVLGNGSDELITLLGLLFVRPGDEVIMGSVTFPVYKTATVVTGGVVVPVPLRDGYLDTDAMAAAVTPRTRMVFLCNPNNPTGTILGKSQVARFLDAIPPEVLVVSDEAYAEFVEDDDYGTLVHHVREGRNVVVLRTFSKVYGLAGLRTGYGLAPTYVVDLLDKVRQAYNQNCVAQAAATAALLDKEHVNRSVELAREGKEFFYREFGAMGLGYYPTSTNFILVDVGTDCVGVSRSLLSHGVIVRPGSPWGLSTSLRITIGTPEQNQMVVSALKEALGT